MGWRGFYKWPSKPQPEVPSFTGFNKWIEWTRIPWKLLFPTPKLQKWLYVTPRPNRRAPGSLEWICPPPARRRNSLRAWSDPRGSGDWSRRRVGEKLLSGGAAQSTAKCGHGEKNKLIAPSFFLATPGYKSGVRRSFLLWRVRVFLNWFPVSSCPKTRGFGILRGEQLRVPFESHFKQVVSFWWA